MGTKLILFNRYMNQSYLDCSTRLTLVTECFYIFNYKDHYDSRIVNMLHITLILSNGVVCLDRLLVLLIVYLDQL